MFLRRFPVRAVVFLLAAAVLPGRGAEKMNILFCFADDWGRYAGALSPLDARPSPNAVVKTPNVDRIAREGVLFRNAFVCAPSCTPCRSALLSGRYFFNTGRGAILQGAYWDAAIPSFPHLLRDAGGYHIGETFKVWSPGRPNDAPFGAGQHAFEKAGGLPNNFSETVTRLVADGATQEAVRERIFGQVRENFSQFLAARKRGQPWFYWFGPTTTHRTWVRGSGKKLWGIEPDALKGRLPKFLPDVPEIRGDMADYLGEIQAFDSYIGVLLQQLEAAGELERTLVVLSGDHGPPGFTHGKCNLYDYGTGVVLAARWPGGKGGRVVEDFVNLMDLAPTFLEAGGVAAPPGINGRSLLPQLKSPQDGWLDKSRDFVVTGRERHVAGAQDDQKPYPSRALRTGDFLYIRNFAPGRWPMGSPKGVTVGEALETNTRAAFPDMDASPTKRWLIEHREDEAVRPFYDFAFAKRPGEELYDLKKDPEQLRNVAADPAYAEKRKALAERLMKILTDAGDPRVTGDGQTFEGPPFTEPDTAAPPKAGQEKSR